MYFDKEAQRLVLELKSERAPHLLFLKGNLGAGKTTFMQALVEALGGSTDSVQSPTFLKLLEYRLLDGRQVLHLDCYRMDSVGQIGALGLEHYESPFLIAVEWPDLFLQFFKGDAFLKRVWSLGSAFEIFFDNFQVKIKRKSLERF